MIRQSPLSIADPRRNVGPWLGALLATLVVAWSIAHFGNRAAPANQWVPHVLIVLTVVLVFARERFAARLALLSPLGFALIAYLIMFGIVPLTDLYYGNPMTHHAMWWRGSWLVWFGLVVLYIGYRLAFIITDSRPRDRSYTWSTARATPIAISLLAISLLSLFLELMRIGVSTYFLKFDKRYDLIENSVPLIIRVTLATPALLLLVGGWVWRPTLRRALVIGVLVLPPVLFASGFAGQRWRDVTIIVSVIAIFHFGYRKIPGPALVGLLLVLVIVFIGFGSQRTHIGKGSAGPSLAGSDFYFNYVRKHDIGQFRDFILTLEGVPRRLEFQHGRTFLSIIPGTSFPTGGYLFSTTFFPVVYAGGTSVPTPLPGELYMNFGMWGIMIGLAIFGYALGWIETFFQRNRGSIGALLVYAYTLLPAAGILRGSFTTFAGFYVLGLVPLVVSLRYIEKPITAETRSQPEVLQRTLTHAPA